MAISFGLEKEGRLTRRLSLVVALAMVNLGNFEVASASTGGDELGLQAPAPVLSLAIDPFDSTTLYAGTLGGGVVRSTDGGVHWSAAAGGLPPGTSVLTVAVQPDETRRLYAGTARQGLFISDDGGLSWTPASLPATGIWSLAFNSDFPSRISAGALQDGAFLRDSKLAEWRSVSGGADAPTTVVAFESLDSSTLWTGTWGAGVRRWSDSNGVSTSPATGTHIWSLIVDPFDASTLYAGTPDSGLVISDDGGNSWRNVGVGLPPFAAVTAMAADPRHPSLVFAGTDSGLFRTFDAGRTWSAAGGEASRAFVLSVAVDPKDSFSIYVGTYLRGVLKSVDGGETWQANRRGLPLRDADDDLENLLSELFRTSQPAVKRIVPRSVPRDSSLQLAGSESLVINEVDCDQGSDDGGEFIEIKNVGDTSVDIGEYAIRTYYHELSGSPRHERYQLSSAILNPGEYFVICRSTNTSAYCDMHIDPPAAAELLRDVKASAVGLVHSASGAPANDTFVDSVCYLAFDHTGKGVDGGLEGGTWTEGVCIQEEESDVDTGFSRVADGHDHNNNQQDFRRACLTPGESNVASDRSCAFGGEPLGRLVINEADVNQPEHPDLAEFVEIKNIGDDAVNLADYKLRHLAYNWWSLLVDQSIRLPEAVLEPDEYHVLCRDSSEVDNCQSEGLFSLNDENGVLAIIHNPADDPEQDILVDTFTYELFYEREMPAAPRQASWIEGELEPETDGVSAVSAAAGMGFSRQCDGADRDHNDDDFRLVPVTPGGPNLWGDEPGQPCNDNGQCFGFGDSLSCICENDRFGSRCGVSVAGVSDLVGPSCDSADPTCFQAPSIFLGGSRIEIGSECSDLFDPSSDDVAEAIIYGPADLDSRPARSTPFAVFVPGSRQSYERYGALLEQSAAAGIVIAVADKLPSPNSIDIESISDIQRCFVRHLRGDWLFADKLNDDLALLGHSRGGKAALLTGQRLPDSEDPNGPVVVRSIVSIAPAGADFPPFPVDIEEDQSDLVAFVFGARDEDTLFSSTRFFDTSRGVSNKVLINIHGADHNGFGGLPSFLGGASGGFPSSRLSMPTQQGIGRSYVNAALFWQLLGEESLRPFLAGDAVPPFVESAVEGDGDPARVFLDFFGTSPGRSQRLIDDFGRAAGSLSPPPDAAISASGFSVAELADPEAVGAVPLQESANSLHLTWVPGSVPLLRYDFSSVLNFGRHTTFSFRGGNYLSDGGGFDGDCARAVAATTDLVIRFFDDSGGIADFSAGQYGAVSVPDQWDPGFYGCPSNMCNAGPVSCFSSYGLSSVRIPVTELCAQDLDIERIRSIEFEFDGSQAGEILIDDLRLTSSQSDPVDFDLCPGGICGNGIAEEDEDCDDANDIDTDACLTDCTSARCGDGILWEGEEQCDDGNTTPSDACTAACRRARCGDGIVWVGEEECDDGNQSDTDRCGNNCRFTGAPFDPECDDEPEGECAGGPCLPTDPLRDELDPFSAFHPDGNHSPESYCVGRDLVCNDTDGFGVCRLCGTDGMLGCPCDFTGDCQVSLELNLVCFGGEGAGWTGSQGFCWDNDDGPPFFQCTEGCTGRSDFRGNSNYYCEHGVDVPGDPRCLSSDCPLAGLGCALEGANTTCCDEGVGTGCFDGCSNECLENAHCSPMFGYPEGFICLFGQGCVDTR